VDQLFEIVEHEDASTIHERCGFRRFQSSGILAANFNKGVTGWDQGDFNYDNVVNGIDFGELAANFNKGASGADLGPSALSDPALVAFAEANGLMADVPEPVSGAIMAGGWSGNSLQTATIFDESPITRRRGFPVRRE
jgi:hypothetical protein